MFHIRMSIRQLLRTPVKTLLFVLLLAAVTIMLVFGSVLYLQAQAHIEAVEEQYTTLGMVTQRPSYTRRVSWEYGCGAQGSAIYDVYDEIIPIDVLDFEGADYVLPPEERLFYMGQAGVESIGLAGSVVRSDGIVFMSESPGPEDPILVELEALKDSAEGGPVSMRVLKQLCGYEWKAETLTLCQHYSSEPLPIEAGEKYMAVLKQESCMEHHIAEFVPMPALYSSQYNPDGTPAEGGASQFHLFYQDGDGSFVTSHTPGGSPVDFQQMGTMIQHEGDADFSMSAWTAWLQTLRNKVTYYPAIATNNMDLLPSWQAKRLKIKDGRAITQEEFDEGAHVCLIPESWNTKHDGMAFNQFVPGPMSELRFPIKLALKSYPASKFDTLGNDTYFDSFSFFDSDGKTYVTYAGGAYEIAGTFTMDLEGLDTGDIDLAANCMIIPAKSLLKQQENIAYFGPMAGTSVSFQIPNGTISEFNRKLHEAVPEADLLEITYSDNGYEQVMPPLERTRTAALLLCAVGAASAVAVIILLLYFFITRERRRTAIERGLGMTKHQCRVSLMAGVLVLALAGSFLGSKLGTMVVSSVDLNGNVDQESSYSVYHTKYSDWTNKWNQVIEVQDVRPVPLLALAVGIPLVLLVLITVLSLVLVGFNLRVEPIMILGGKDG